MTYKHSRRFAKVANYSIFACPLHFITRLLCQKREIWQPVSDDFAYLLLEPCPHYGHNSCNQNSDRSDWQKWWTSKGGPVFSKLFQLDPMDPLSFGPKFPEISVEWIVPYNCQRATLRWRGGSTIEPRKTRL